MEFWSEVESGSAVTMAGREPALQPILWESTLDARTLEREHGAMLPGGFLRYGRARDVALPASICWSMSICASVLTTVGLLLDIIGVILLFLSLRSGVVRVGNSGNLEDGSEGDNRLSDPIRYAALALIIVGFVLQGIAVWV